MNVSFTTTEYDSLPDVDVINGQIIAISDRDELYYDMGNERRLASGTRFVAALPQTGQEGLIYITISATGVAAISVWDPTTSSYITIGGGKQISTITKAAYNQLPASRKTADFIYFVPDATSPSDLT